MIAVKIFQQRRHAKYVEGSKSKVIMKISLLISIIFLYQQDLKKQQILRLPVKLFRRVMQHFRHFSPVL